jgi:hypothetical protein
MNEVGKPASVMLTRSVSSEPQDWHIAPDRILVAITHEFSA